MNSIFSCTYYSGQPITSFYRWTEAIRILSKTQCIGTRLGPTAIKGGGEVMWSGHGGFLKGYPTIYPLCGCCAAQCNFADQYAHTALLSKVGQILLDFYIADAEQWLTCQEGATSKTGGGGTVGCRDYQNYLVCAWGAASLGEVVAAVYKNWYSVLPLSF